MWIPFYKLIKNPLCSSPLNFANRMLDMAYLLGTPLTYLHERKGALFHKIWAHPEKTNEPSTLGSGVPLGFHTEMAFHSIKPSYIMLYCVSKGQIGTTTDVVIVDNVLESMTLREKRLLMEPLYKIYPPVSYQQKYPKPDWTPLLYNRQVHRLVLADHCKMEFKQPRAFHVYQRLLQVCNEQKKSIMLDPGDTLIINNTATLHGRNAYVDPARILCRLYIW